MRYSVISKGLTISQLQSEVVRCGGRNLKIATASKQIFCELDDAGMARLKNTPGLAVKTLGKTFATDVISRAIERAEAQLPTYAASQASLFSAYYQFRNAFTPPVLGSGWTVCLLDSGILKTHRGLVDKVILSKNYTTSPTDEDVFSHGTGTAYLCAGGRHAIGEESGVAPGASLINLKVLGDEGEGEVEDVIIALEDVIALKKEAITKGLSMMDPGYPNAVNMSLGTEDNNDPDNPFRLAIDAIVAEGDIAQVASAGNGGPGAGTITFPASHKGVVCVGAMEFYPFEIANFSSRGPTKEGLVKPDWVWFCMNIITASATHNDAFEVKSGTSFAAPIFAGGMGIGYEAAARLGLITPELFGTLTKEDFEKIFSATTRKPEGAPAEKDNTYGYGQPFGDLVLRLLGVGVPAVSISGLVESITPLISLALLSTIMLPMVK